MKTKVKNNVYNENLVGRLDRLEYLYKRALSAENFTDVQSLLIRKAGEFITELKLQSGANINGIEISETESFLRFLENTNIEHKTLPFTKVVGYGSSSSSREKKELYIPIPEGWDGRNGFIFYRLFGVQDPTVVGENINSNPPIIPMERLIELDKDQYITVSQNRKNIVINSYIRGDLIVQAVDNVDNVQYFDYYELRGYMTMWRNR